MTTEREECPEPSERLRIAHLTTSDVSLAKLLFTELEEDVKRGHRVFAISAPGPYVAEIERAGVTHVAVPALSRGISPRSDVSAIGQLSRVLRHLRLDVIHTHTPKAGVLGRIVGRLSGIPVVVNTCHGLSAAPDDIWIKRMAVYGVETAAALFSDAELFQNHDDYEIMARVLGRRHVTLVGNGTDLLRFRFDPDGRHRVRAEWEVGPSEVLIGAVGRRVRMKGVQEFSEAAGRLTGRASFVWIGPQDPARRDALPDDLPHVRFVGERTDMPAVYSALDVFVLPSYREGLPRSAMEAAACGRPMVLTSVRGTREFQFYAVPALWVPSRRADSLALQLERLVRDPGLREALGNAAAEGAGRAFDQRRVAARSLGTYAQVRQRQLRATRGRRHGLSVSPRR